MVHPTDRKWVITYNLTSLCGWSPCVDAALEIGLQPTKLDEPSSGVWESLARTKVSIYGTYHRWWGIIDLEDIPPKSGSYSCMKCWLLKFSMWETYNPWPRKPSNTAFIMGIPVMHSMMKLHHEALVTWCFCASNPTCVDGEQSPFFMAKTSLFSWKNPLLWCFNPNFINKIPFFHG